MIRTRATALTAALFAAATIASDSSAAGSSVRSFRLPPRTYGHLIAGLDGAPWFVAEASDTTSTLKIADPALGSFRDVPLPFKAHVGVALDGAGWLLAPGAQGTGTLWRVDPVTAQSTQVAATDFVGRVIAGDARAHRVYFADEPQTGGSWQLHAVDTATQTVTTVATFAARAISAQTVATDGAVWLAVVDRGDPSFGIPDSSLLRLDPATGQLATVIPSTAVKYLQLAPAPGGDLWMVRAATPPPKGFDVLQAARVRADGRLTLIAPPALLGAAGKQGADTFTGPGPTAVVAAPDGTGWFLQATPLPVIGSKANSFRAWSLIAVDPATGRQAYTALPDGSPEELTSLGDGTFAYYDEPAATPAKAVVRITPGALTTAAPKPPTVARSVSCRHRCRAYAQLWLSLGGRTTRLASRALSLAPGRHAVRLTPGRQWAVLFSRLTHGTLGLEILLADGKRHVALESHVQVHPAAPVEPPVPGVAQSESGQVLVQLPSGGDFAPLAAGTSLPSGTVVDARQGSLTFASAANARGGGQSATVSAGIFRIKQRSRAQTDFVLVTPPGLARACASGRPRPAKGVVRTLSVRVSKGMVRTVAAKGVTTAARGAAWTTSDRCDGTFTQVRRGRVTVRAGRHRVTVRAGRSYLVKAQLFRAKQRTG